MDDAFGRVRLMDPFSVSLSLSVTLFCSLRDFFVRMPFCVEVARAMGKYGADRHGWIDVSQLLSGLTPGAGGFRK